MITARDVNAVFRGDVYGDRDVFTDEAFARFVRANDVDIERSTRVAEHRELVGLALLARRAERGWIGGFGIAPAFRRSGNGGRVLEAALTHARAAGIASIELEVMHRNEGAARLYRRYGFETIGELVVWSRDAAPGDASRLAFIARTHEEVERIAATPAACWQREARSVAGAGASALVTAGNAYAFVAIRDGRAVLLDAGAHGDAAARALVAELERSLPAAVTLLNEPEESPLSRALRDAGWRIAERQHRMRLRL